MNRRRPTIDDVAELSGVARVTVSRVLNDQPNVSARTREKVLAAVTTLGFAVNVRARQLAGGRHQTILLICASSVDQEPNSFYSSALEIGALRACAQQGFDLVRQSADRVNDDDAAILKLADESRCAGVILSPPFSDDTVLIERLLKGRRVVSISPGASLPAGTSSVSMDDEAAGYIIAARLIALGHRRFGFLHGEARHLAAEGRWQGVLRAVREVGLGENAIVARRGNFTFRSGSELLPEILAEQPGVTAIMCANDDMAVGVLFAAHQRGLSVPDRLSITGFDDTPVSALVWPPLTTIHQPIADMAYRAIEILGAQLQDNEEYVGIRELLPFNLIERGSTASIPVLDPTV